jgi:hypothetical protein
MNDSTLGPSKIIPLDYSQVNEFLHCKDCLEKFIGSKLYDEMSPQDYGNYEFGTCNYVYPDGEEAEIVTIWCKRCHKCVWDSRHLMTKM